MPITVGTNTYATLTEARDYLFETLRAPDWNVCGVNNTDPDKLTGQEAALTAAAKLIDRQALRGSKLNSAQALAFPRNYQLAGVPVEVKHAQIETAYWLLTDYLKRRAAPAPTLDAGNFLDGMGSGPDGSIGIKLTVAGVTVEEGGEAPTKKITFAPAQPIAIPQLPIELPPAALLLLKEHLAMGITLER